MKQSHAFLLLVVFLALIMSACSSKPTAMIQRTEQARQEAVNEHADQFAPDDWGAAEQSWQDASAQISAEKYGQASTLLLKAQTRFQKARDIAKGKRVQAIQKITSDQKGATARLETLKKDPGFNRLPAARKKALEDRVKEIEDSIAKVTDLLNNSQYSEAQLLAAKAFRDAWEAQQEFLK